MEPDKRRTDGGRTKDGPEETHREGRGAHADRRYRGTCKQEDARTRGRELYRRLLPYATGNVSERTLDEELSGREPQRVVV